MLLLLLLLTDCYGCVSAEVQLTVAGSLLLLALVGVIVASAAYSTPWGLFVREWPADTLR